WLMDTTSPTSTVDPLPPITTSTTFNVSVTGSDPSGAGGSTPSGLASFAIYASTDNGAFSFWTTVTPATPSAVFTGMAGHSYGFYSVATDRAGNVQPTPAAAQAATTVASALTLLSVGPVAPNPRNESVSTINVTFSEPINLATFTTNALALTDNGGPNLITNKVMIKLVSGSTYRISGLAKLTAAEGRYILTVNSAGVLDQHGNAGSRTLLTSLL